MPTEVDFDALWENVYQPVLEKDLGSKAVRADRDVGALIISQMVPLPLRSLLDSGALHQLVNAL